MIEKFAAGLDEFYLLVHYDLARVYNSPVETLTYKNPAEPGTFRFADAAHASADFISDERGVFDNIFLFVPDNDAQPVFRLYPREDRSP